MIDTIELKITADDAKKLKPEDINRVINEYSPFLIESKNRQLNSKEIRLVLRLDPNKTRPLTEFNKIILAINKELKIKLNINRFDIAFDFEKNINENRQLFYFFQASLNYVRTGSISNIFSTERDFDTINYKVKYGRNLETTVYDHTDKKNRFGKTRIENRILNVRRNSKYNQIIKDHIISYNSDLDKIINNFSKIEEEISEFLYKNWYQENVKANKIASYIQILDCKGLICTRDILDLLLQKMNYSGTTESFIKNFRRQGKNRLKFETKGSISSLIKQIKSDNKSILK